MAHIKRVIGQHTDDICKATRLTLESDPTKWKEDQVFKKKAAATFSVVPSQRNVTVIRCPLNPDMDSPTSDPLPEEQGVVVAFTFNSGVRSLYHIPFTGSAPFNTAQFLTTPQYGSIFLDMKFDAVNRRIFTLESASGDQYLVRYDYTVSELGVWSVTGNSLLDSWVASGDAAESMHINRANGHVFVGIGQFAAFIVNQYEWDGSNETLLHTGGGTQSPRWFAINQDETLMWAREFSGGGADELHSIDLTTGIDTDTGIDPPTSSALPTHDVFLDTLTGFFYEQDRTSKIIYQVPIISPVWSSIVVPSISLTSDGFTIMRGREKLVFADDAGDLYWVDYPSGSGKTLIFDRSVAGLATGNVFRVDDGYD